jgi:hypothetical protein
MKSSKSSMLKGPENINEANAGVARPAQDWPA